MTIISALRNAMNHAASPGTCAVNLGFIGINGKTPEETRTVKDKILPPRFSKNLPLDSKEKINLLQEFAGSAKDDAETFATFLNTVIRVKDGEDVRWLNVAARTNDAEFTRFLLESGANLDLCNVTTRDSLQELANDVGFQTIDGMTAQEIQNAVRAIRQQPNSDTRIAILTPHIDKIDVNAVIRKQGGKEYTLLDFAAEIDDGALALYLIRQNASQCSQTTKDKFNVQFELVALEKTHSMAPTAGKATEITKRDIGSYLRRLSNPIFLAAVVAGGSLYAAPIIFNGLISAGYITAQAIGAVGVLPFYAIDKTISAGINLASSSLGYGKVETHYYLTKTVGGLACLTGLAAVALCANNPVSVGFRLACMSGPAYLGAMLISWGLEGGQKADMPFYNDRVASLNQLFESTQPDMQKENWGKIKSFIYNLATGRGFKDNYKNAFAIPNTDPVNAPTYPGIIKGTLATFAVRIYA